MTSGDLVDIFDPAMTQQLPSPSWVAGLGVWSCLAGPSESAAHRLLEQPWPPVLVPSRQAHADGVVPLTINFENNPGRSFQIQKHIAISVLRNCTALSWTGGAADSRRC